MGNLKKTGRIYGIWTVSLLLLCSLLTACQSNALSMESIESQTKDSAPIREDSAEFSSTTQDSKETVQLKVIPGSYLIQILQQLADSGVGQSVEELLRQIDSLAAQEFEYWGQVSNRSERAFVAEGYIAPGQYEWPREADTQTILSELLHSWDHQITEEMNQQAGQQGYTMDQILIMASIVEHESSFDPSSTVKPQVAAVVRNRVETPTALQMDVTIFYLQQALQPYRTPEDFETYYDTYQIPGLPAGPIGSPSLDSIRAVLEPADTQDLFFVYDDEGNYYFAEDYEQHLVNCQLAGLQ